MFEVTVFGAGKEVGRSCILVRTDKNILLDAGVQVGKDLKPEVKEVEEIDAVVVSHAHLDHTGFLPTLVEMGYDGPVYMTKPTRDLTHLLLADYYRIGKEKDRVPFSSKAMEEAIKRVKTVEYGESFRVGKTWLRLFDAGHILGSGQILVKYKGERLLYSGDVNVRETKLHEGAVRGIEADYLITEATYGGKEDVLPSFKRMARELAEGVRRTLERGGHVLVPVFAVGRAQEVLLILESYMRSGFIPRTKIFLEGMIKKANRIYRLNVVFLRKEIVKRILMADDDPFKSPYFAISRKKNREDVLESPSIILSTSGMFTGGPALFYLKKLAPDPKNTIILVGYQVEGSLGRRLVEGEREVEVRGEKVEVNAEVLNLHISAHADRRGLEEYVKGVRGVKEGIVVHSEGEKAEEFAGWMEGKGIRAVAGENGETYVLGGR